MNAGEGPTIFGVQPGAETTKFQSYYYDMSNESYVKNIAPNMDVKIDGKNIGVPIGVEGFGFVYNKDLVDPAKITDLASFKAFLEESKSNGINGFSLSQEAYFLIGHILNTPFALQQDPVAFIDQLNKGEVKMADTKEFQEFAQYMEAIRESAKNPLEVTYDTQMGDFATGKTAIVHQGNWSYGMLQDYKDINAGMMAMPLAGNTKLAVDIPAIWVINNKASADQIKAANAFLEWLYNSETGKKNHRRRIQIHSCDDEYRNKQPGSAFPSGIRSYSERQHDSLGSDLLPARHHPERSGSCHTRIFPEQVHDWRSIPSEA